MSKDDEIAAIERAMVHIRRSQTRRTLGKEAERSLGEGVGLHRLAVVDAVEAGPAEGEDEVTVGDVAERLGIDPSRASRLVGAAIEAGLLERALSHKDARRVGITLTRRGRKLAAAAHAFRRRVFDEVMKDWRASERKEFARLLTRFTEGLADRAR